MGDQHPKRFRRAAAMFVVVLAVVIAHSAILASAARSGAETGSALARLDAARAHLAAEAGLTIAIGEMTAGREPPVGLVTIAGDLRYEVIERVEDDGVTTVVVEGRTETGLRRLEAQIVSPERGS